jgi:TolB-like protein
LRRSASDAIIAVNAMNLKTAFIAFAISFLALAAAAQNSGASDQDPSGRTLSVLYFDNVSKSRDLDWLRAGLSDMLATDIAASGAVTVVERERLAEVLKEQELQLSGMVGDEGAVRVGEMLAASKIVCGSFIAEGPSLRIEARIVDTRSAAVLGAAKAEGRGDEALVLEREIAAGLLDALGAGARATPSSGGTSKSAAAAAYYRGLAALDSGAYRDAQASFLEASALDPAYAKPQSGLEAAYRFLKDFKRQRQQHEMTAIASSLQRLRSRVEGVFYSFADMVSRPVDFGFADVRTASAAYQADPRGYSGDSPVQAMWNMQMLLIEMASKAGDYFSDEMLASRCYEDVGTLAAEAESRYPKDPFLAEALYAALLPLRWSGKWAELKAGCERLMGEYPDYRMAESVEAMYEAALDKLSGNVK